MVEILEEPSVRRRAVPISVATYHRMSEAGMVDRKTELVRGVIIEKMSKSPLHSFLTGSLHRHCTVALQGAWLTRREDPLTLQDSEPEPDIAIVTGVAEDYLHHHPRTAKLVIEINTSNENLDREMAPVYAEAGVEEYWIVLGLKKAIEVYLRPDGGLYQERRNYSGGESVTSAALPELSLKLSTLFPS